MLRWQRIRTAGLLRTPLHASRRTVVRLGLGGRVGSGAQGMSWIHELDMNRLFERAIDDPRMQGTYIASSPNPVSQSAFMRELRRSLRMPIGLPAFSWMVRIGAPYFMRTDPELALYGRYVVSKRLEEEQFEFQFPKLREALEELACISSRRRRRKRSSLSLAVNSIARA